MLRGLFIILLVVVSQRIGESLRPGELFEHARIVDVVLLGNDLLVAIVRVVVDETCLALLCVRAVRGKIQFYRITLHDFLRRRVKHRLVHQIMLQCAIILRQELLHALPHLCRIFDRLLQFHVLGLHLIPPADQLSVDDDAVAIALRLLLRRPFSHCLEA